MFNVPWVLVLVIPSNNSRQLSCLIILSCCFIGRLIKFNCLTEWQGHFLFHLLSSYYSNQPLIKCSILNLDFLNIFSWSLLKFRILIVNRTYTFIFFRSKEWDLQNKIVLFKSALTFLMKNNTSFEKFKCIVIVKKKRPRYKAEKIWNTRFLFNTLYC